MAPITLSHRTALPGPMAVLDATPILRGKTKKYYSFTFPDFTLQAQEFNSSVLKFPADAIFLIRQTFFTPDTGPSNPGGSMGKGRLSISSGIRSNMALSNDLLFLENMGAMYLPRITHILPFPSPVMPGSVMTFEAQNIDSGAHLFKMTLEGELVYSPDAKMLKFFNSYTWFQYIHQAVNYDASANPTTFSEIRTHPDADFYLTHIITQGIFGNDNASGTVPGPVRIKIYLGSQGEPIMDSNIHTLNLCGMYFWNNPGSTILSSHFAQPYLLPYPVRVPAGASIFITLAAPFASPASTIDLALEGIKLFI